MNLYYIHLDLSSLLQIERYKSGHTLEPVIKNTEKNNHNLVSIKSIIPDAVLDIRYATPNNFTHKIVYPPNIATCYLMHNAAQALARAAQEFKALGYTIKIWDAYRPLQAQYIFWKLVPDERYVANPQKGSRHNRGCAVDITLVDTHGKELNMGTDFDDFTQKAHRDFYDLNTEIINNRTLLQSIMEKHNFIGWHNEWWHFDFKDWEQYPILDIAFNDIKP